MTICTCLVVDAAACHGACVIAVVGQRSADQEIITLGGFVVSAGEDYRKSYVEVSNLKLGVRDELLQQWLRKTNIDPSNIAKLQEALADFKAARRIVNPYPDGKADPT